MIADDLSTSGIGSIFQTRSWEVDLRRSRRVNVDGRAAIKLTGNVTIENNGGFVQVRRNRRRTRI